jgi:hypothetical protein
MERTPEAIAKNTEAAVGLIGEEKWKEIEVRISDLLLDAIHYKKHNVPQDEFIQNIFHEIWWTQEVSSEFGNELNDDDHYLLADCVYHSVRWQVKVQSSQGE